MNRLIPAAAAVWIPRCLLVAGLVSSPAHTAWAEAPSGADPAATADVACLGKVWHVYGEVLASSERGTRTLKEDDPVYVGEHIHAGATAEAVIRTTDAGVVAIRPNAEFVPDTYVAQGQATDGMTLHIVKGSLRLISGWIGQVHREGVQVVMATATIGIRGTDHEPFALPEELADSTPYEAGSYDKVNRGSTVLKSSTGEVEIVAGQTGFAPVTGAPAQSSQPDRVLMTLLLPRLLDRVPKFFVPGRFEREINEYSHQAEDAGQQKLQELKAGAAAGCAGTIKTANSQSSNVVPKESAATDPRSVARRWISHLDAAAMERNTGRILRLFASDASIDATVLGNDGQPISTRLNRKQFARSVRESMAAVQDFRQNRQTLDAELDTAADGGQQVKIVSHVVEQGRLNGSDYRVESDETYWLEQRAGAWVAVKASSVQR